MIIMMKMMMMMLDDDHHFHVHHHHVPHHVHPPNRGALLFHIRFRCAVRPDCKCRGCVVMIVMITASDAEDA